MMVELRLTISFGASIFWLDGIFGRLATIYRILRNTEGSIVRSIFANSSEIVCWAFRHSLWYMTAIRMSRARNSLGLLIRGISLALRKREILL